LPGPFITGPFNHRRADTRRSPMVQQAAI
jgi:hypothetical protein